VRLNCADYEIWIHPGDIIIGDADGVVCLPRSLVSDVLKLLPQLVSGNAPEIERR
jgi:regulator of RNase E activity RraA